MMHNDKELTSFPSNKTVNKAIKIDYLDLIKQYSPSVITFLIMHFLYFPLLSSCLLMNYMLQNGFFNYEIISKNFFAISISTSLMIIMLGMLSLITWSYFGYQFLIKRKITNNDRLTSILLAGLNIVSIIILLLAILFSDLDIMQSIVIVILSGVLMVFYCYYFTSEIKYRLIMIGFLTGITAFAIFAYGHNSSLLFGKALNIFGLGGGHPVIISFNTKSYEKQKGSLFLLTPEFVYYKEEHNIVILPMNNIKSITIEKTKKQSE